MVVIADSIVVRLNSPCCSCKVLSAPMGRGVVLSTVDLVHSYLPIAIECGACGGEHHGGVCTRQSGRGINIDVLSSVVATEGGRVFGGGCGENQLKIIIKHKIICFCHITLSVLQSQLVEETGKAKLKTTKSSLKKQISESNLMRL